MINGGMGVSIEFWKDLVVGMPHVQVIEFFLSKSWKFPANDDRQSIMHFCISLNAFVF